MMYIFHLMKVTEGRVWAEIHLDRIANNYELIKKKVGRCKILAAIKADAYGHGAVEVARALEAHGVFMFGVASIEEGIELRQAGITTRILILSPILYAQSDALFEYNLIPTISEMRFFRTLEKRAKFWKKVITAHVEVDTGMTRTGFPIDEAEAAISTISRSTAVKVGGFFSHFPMAEANGSFTGQQIAVFKTLVERLNCKRLAPDCIHMANSSGIYKHRASYFDLVRPGIALYGLTSSPEISYHADLKPAMELRTRVVSIRDVGKNTAISYGHTYRTDRKRRIATISVGYADGYPRALSNIGSVLVHGCRVPIVGAVCMDLTMIDVSGIPGVRVGDMVTLIGRAGDIEITAEECAEKCRTIVYEITSGIGPRVARLFRFNNRVVWVRNLLGRWRFDKRRDVEEICAGKG